MAVRKKVTDEVQPSVEQVQYTKEQILTSKKYRKTRDIVDAVLDDSTTYSMCQVDKLINDFMKGQVK
ncbi:MAG: hypothetical protein R3Y47_02145 [Lachnospiraceae bacterium]